MKSYEQIADSILEKYNSRLEAKRRRNKIIFRSAAVLSGAAAVIGIGIFTTALKAPKMPDPVKPGIIIESETTATNESEYITTQTKNEGTSLTSQKNTTAIKTEISSTVTAPQNTSVSTEQTMNSTATAVNAVNGTAQSKPAASTVNTTFAATAQTTFTSKTTLLTTAQTTLTAPETTTVVTTTVDNDAERSNYMKKVLSMLTAAAMLTPVAMNNSYAADTNYKDPAERYGLGSRQYEEAKKTISPAEQELFDRIENGIIDVDIDRNGEIDMRDAEYIYFYELRRYMEEDTGYDMFAENYKKGILNFDLELLPEEAREFLENREDIRNKELFSMSKNYSAYQVATLDTRLVTRYVMTHNFKPEYFTKDYYSDVAVYDVITNYDNERFFYFITGARDDLINILRTEQFTGIESLMDFNGDGVFDLHDGQDFEEFQFMYEVEYDDYEKIVNADSVDITQYRAYPQSKDSITEDIFKNIVKFNLAADKWERGISFGYEWDNPMHKTSSIGFMDMIELFFLKNDFKLIYTTPEYYKNERPNCEGLPLYDRIDFYNFVSQYAGSRGYVTTKLSFNETNFNTFYEKWSNDVKNQKASIPDVNGNGIIDVEDNNYINQYEKEIWSKIPEEETKLPKEIRKYLDEDFDLNGNGISGDVNDVMAAIAYIRINYPDIRKMTAEQSAAWTYSAPKGDANCDGKVSVADSVAILQYIGNRDRYDLKEQGKLNADVNGDGAVTGLDALEIQRMDSLDN